MKKGLLILLIGIFIIGFVNGAGSETESNFTIPGCNFGETGLINGSCSKNGGYFCNYEDGNYSLYNTLYDYRGCSYGANKHTPGQPFCCPLGYFCENSVRGPICNLREEECSNQSTQSDCENIGCHWLPIDGGICVESPADYGCGIYKTSETCNEDIFRLGQIGVGTNICGTYFTVNNIEYLRRNCRCEWDGPVSICRVVHDTVEEFNNGTANSFKCKKSFSIGDCIEGVQLITWNAIPQIISGYLSGVPLEILEADGCTDNVGGTERACGTSTIKLFVFSLFSFFMSLGIIGLFYFLRELKDQTD
ncbi:hypothetical protein KAJ38_00375 [Candidatus Pacearchaeota archaeon]|nr:hypothetical protein [Candidatus Pacearchaeota archaeon]